MKIHIIDTETTGLDPVTDRVIQIAAVELTLDPDTKKWIPSRGTASFVNPGRPIPPEATGVHHIIDSDVESAPMLDQALETVLNPLFMVDVCAAHNAPFDKSFLPSLAGRRWLDTLRCSKHIFPDAPNFKNSTLYYFLGFKRPDGIAPHSALFDAKITTRILIKLLAERTLEELLVLSRKAVLLKKVGFGQHFGKLWADVDTRYLEWANGVEGLDPDVKFTVKKELARRAAGNPNAPAN
jgi:exodeoxyribonuclease X